MAKHMLLATDGSELGERAVLHGLELAKALGAQVTTMTVTDIIPTGPPLFSHPLALRHCAV